jgi:hypothetical protein
MLTILNLEEISAARLHDAQALYAARRYDGAYYLAGYSLELALKARICKTLNWADFPLTPNCALSAGYHFTSLGYSHLRQMD